MAIIVFGSCKCIFWTAVCTLVFSYETYGCSYCQGRMYKESDQEIQKKDVADHSIKLKMFQVTGQCLIFAQDTILSILGDFPVWPYCSDIFPAGLWKYHARLALPGPISFRTSWKFLFICPWTSISLCIKLIQFCISYFD